MSIMGITSVAAVLVPQQWNITTFRHCPLRRHPTINTVQALMIYIIRCHVVATSPLILVVNAFIPRTMFIVAVAGTSNRILGSQCIKDPNHCVGPRNILKNLTTSSSRQSKRSKCPKTIKNVGICPTCQSFSYTEINSLLLAALIILQIGHTCLFSTI